MKPALTLLLVLLTGLLTGCGPAMPESTPAESPASLHERILTLDTHCDTPLRIMGDKVDMGRDNTDRRAISKLDFIRMERGGLDVSFFAVFISQGKRTPEGLAIARAKTFKTLDVVDSVLSTHSELAVPATRAADASQLAASGKRVIYLGLENGFPIGKDLDMIQTFYDRGIRYITLCHVRNNDICDSSTDSAEFGGLSEFGEEVVTEMNRLGLMVDVSHISDDAVRDVLQVTKAPIIASHSCARAVRDHARNLPDDLLKAIADNGGVIQLCILSHYVKETGSYPERDSARAAWKAKWEPLKPWDAQEQDQRWAEEDIIDDTYPPILATVSDAIDHLDHMIEVAGIDHVGIGTDFDGGGGLADCFDASELPNLTTEMLKRGYTEEMIAKIWSGNLLRVFGEVEEVATGM